MIRLWGAPLALVLLAGCGDKDTEGDTGSTAAIEDDAAAAKIAELEAALIALEAEVAANSSSAAQVSATLAAQSDRVATVELGLETLGTEVEASLALMAEDLAGAASADTVFDLGTRVEDHELRVVAIEGAGFASQGWVQEQGYLLAEDLLPITESVTALGEVVGVNTAGIAAGDSAIAELNALTDVLSADLLIASEATATLATTASDLRVDLDSTVNTIERLDADYVELSDEVVDLRIQADDTQTAVASLDADFIELSTEFTDQMIVAGEQLVAQSEAITNGASAVAALDLRVTDAETLLVSEGAAFDGLSVTVSDIESTQSDLTDSLSAVAISLSDVTDSVDALALDVSDAQSDAADAIAGVDGLSADVEGVVADVEGVVADVEGVETDLDAVVVESSGLVLTVAALDVEVGVLSDEIGAVGDDLVTLSDEVDALESSGGSSAELDELLAVMAVTPSGDVVISGANLFLQSGSGATDGAVNGKGNLIIGYGEDDGGDDISGSHNLVVGSFHSYPGYGGIVAGLDNTLLGNHASILGGEGSFADELGSILGGLDNQVTAAYGAVVGGNGNVASASRAAVLGGQTNQARHPNAVVTGGRNNNTSTFDEVVP